MNKFWRVWAKALGDKSGKTDKEADYVAMIRTFIFLQLIITNCFIISGVSRHWNNMSQQSDKMRASVTRFEFCNSNDNQEKERKPEDGQTQESDGGSDSSR